jgi:hypothetical protein
LLDRLGSNNGGGLFDFCASDHGDRLIYTIIRVFFK